MSESQQGSRTKQITSQFEGYLGAIQDQEIQTKLPFPKRQIDYGKIPTGNNKCCLGKVDIEDVNHVISSCPEMSIRYYIPLRHDDLTECIL